MNGCTWAFTCALPDKSKYLLVSCTYALQLCVDAKTGVHLHCIQHEGMRKAFQDTHPPLSFPLLAVCVCWLWSSSQMAVITQTWDLASRLLWNNGWLARIKPLWRLSFYFLFTKLLITVYSTSTWKLCIVCGNWWVEFLWRHHLSSQYILNNHEQRPWQGDR